jgi:flagellar biosynthesis/type III secretory pathway chaperone
MSDEERLTAIDTIWKEMQDQITFLRSFNEDNKILALQRAKERNNVQAIEYLYGINH